MNERFLKEAIRIGDQLIAMANRDEHGLSWQSMGVGDQETAWRTTEDIYSGGSGIALFLLELYKRTGNKAYLKAVNEAMAWIDKYCDAHPTDNYALVTGRMGVSYAYLQLYKTTKKPAYLEKALAIAKPCQNSLSNLKEYINGASGTLLGLLHLHAESQESWLLEAIEKYTQYLLDTAKLSTSGMYWDLGMQQVRPLCGFSHGVSGIGFVLLELGYYFNNPAFYEIAAGAFAYEDSYYDAKMANWPDFRLSMWEDYQVAGFEKAYVSGDLKPFTKAEDMNAWCHGAAGISLARMRAHTLTGDKKYLKDVKRALGKTKTTTGRLANFSLCHGEGGNAEGYIEGYKLFHNPKDLKQAEQIADGMLAHRKKSGRYISGMELYHDGEREDPSLFNGIAGVGYFLLRIHDPENTPSILAPALSRALSIKTPSGFSATPATLRKHIIGGTFPRTVAQLPTSEKLDRYFEKDFQDSLKDSFIQYVKTVIGDLPAARRRELTDVFTIEQLKLDLASQRPSSGLLYIKERLAQNEAQKILQLSDGNLLSNQLKLAEECMILEIEKNKPILLKLTSTDVEELHISPFCRTILRTFTDAKSIGHAVEELAKLYGAQSTSERKRVQEKALLQIREALVHDVLIAVGQLVRH